MEESIDRRDPWSGLVVLPKTQALDVSNFALEFTLRTMNAGLYCAIVMQPIPAFELDVLSH